jgi:5-methylcytosine-specific restriction endonuclease McrA
MTLAKRGDPRLTRDYKAFRLRVLARDQWSCFYCQQPATTVDHIIPVSKAPDLVVNYENAVACCQPCNSKKGSRNQGVFLGRQSTPPVFQGNLSPRAASVIPENPFVTETTPAIN